MSLICYTSTYLQDCHDYYCTKFLKRTTPLCDGFEITGGTSRLNTLQFSDFIEKIIADAASDFGICLPDPNDIHFAEFMNEYERYI